MKPEYYKPNNDLANVGLALFRASLLAVCVGVGFPAHADDSDLARRAQGILSDKCFHCHGPDAKTRQADLRLDTKGGIEVVIVPGAPDESELIRRITSDDPDEHMPPAESKLVLTDEQISTLRQWVESGGKWQGHWAFQPIRRPRVPDDATGWSSNSIDAFVLERMKRDRLAPLEPASKEKLLRRVTFDLTGLPPTLKEIDDFLADESEAAYQKVLDRLFASPRYGERMVWEWLEAARYADTNGFQGDPERTMWPWRDWVIKAFNDNMPFDQFTIEQLAGDMLPDATLSQRIASGFNRNHMFNGEGGRIAEETRVENVFDRTETTATVWMGLTLTCCRCHDHKYDPITQQEYFGLYAFFNNTSETGSPGGRRGQIAPVVDYQTPEETARLVAIEKQIRAASQAVQTHEADGSKVAESPPEIVKLLAKKPRQRGVGGIDKLLARFKSDQEYSKLLNDLKKPLQQRDRVLNGIARVMIMDDLKTPRKTFLLNRGVYNNPGQEVTAHLPSVLPRVDVERPDRLKLAKWLIDPAHPLTARVTVNRYWQLFFGTGLVATPENFGIQGDRPSHPELLDWLAAEFQSDWDTKRLHRLIVSSSTYRQTSSLRPSERDQLESDPTNRLLARGPRHRLSAAMVRDNALAVSGLLVESIGGPSVKPYQPDGVWAAATFGKKKYTPDTGSKLYRRSVYTFWRRIIGPTMFFDSARRQSCEVKTSRTNTPLHALLTLNGVTYVEAARTLAERLIAESPDRTQQLRTAFRLATSREPLARELLMLGNRLTDLERLYERDRKAAAELLSIGESGRNKELDPVQHAALASACLLILNLDEALTK